MNFFKDFPHQVLIFEKEDKNLLQNSRPQSGQLFIHKYKNDENQVNKAWRKDNHSYQLRKNQNSAQENMSKLKIGGCDAIVCSYFVGAGNDTATPATLKRRAYWLVEQPEYVIVHYLDENMAKE